MSNGSTPSHVGIFSGTTFAAFAAAILGTSFALTPGLVNDPGKGTKDSVMIGGQEIPSEKKDAASRAARMREPFRDFFGLPPFALPDSSNSSSAFWKELFNKKIRGVPQLDEELIKKLANYELEFLFLTVADPVDSVENYLFDHQIDALQKALNANPKDHWLYSGGYFPWQAFKDWKTVDKKVALFRHEHWYQDEPGVMLFRQEEKESDKKEPENKKPLCKRKPDIDATPRTSPTTKRLLVVYLVGESPTLGIQRDAFNHAVVDFKILLNSRYGACADAPLRIIGPTFTGGAFSLREALSDMQDLDVHPQIITPSATAIQPEDFPSDWFLGSAVCSLQQTKSALKEITGNQPVAWLVETGTAFGSSQSKESTSEKNHLVFPYPMGISRVRKSFEDQVQTARRQATNLKPLGPTSPLPFDADETTLDVPPIQTPQLTSPSAQLVLEEIMRNIAIRKIPYVAIQATDVRDTIFLAEIVKLRCPNVQLLIPEPNILYTHPEYVDSMRGAIVASSYPLFPEGQEACRNQSSNPSQMSIPLMGDQTFYGIFNAVLAQRFLQRDGNPIHKWQDGILNFKNLNTYRDDYFVGLLPTPECCSHPSTLSPRVWLHTVGYDRFYPLKVVSPTYPYSLKVPRTTFCNQSATLVSFTPHHQGFAWFPMLLGFVAIWGLLFAGSFSRNKATPPEPARSDCPGQPSGDSRQQATVKGYSSFVRTLGLWFEKPLFSFPRSLYYLLMIAALVTCTCWFLPLFVSFPCDRVDASTLYKITEAYIFSGVSLLLPLLCTAGALIAMCYIKLRQAYSLSPEKMTTGLEASLNQYAKFIERMGNGWTIFSSKEALFYLAILGFAAIATFIPIFRATHDSSNNPSLFWSVFGFMGLGYGLWWFSACELLDMYYKLTERAKEIISIHPTSTCRDTLGYLNQKGLKGLYAVLFGPSPNRHDVIGPLLDQRFKNATQIDDLINFREIQYRLILIKNQFELLLIGAMLLLMGVLAYPFTSSALWNLLATLTLLTFIIGLCVLYWNMERNEHLSKILGSTPNAIEWNLGNLFFFVQYLSLGAFLLVIQLVPGAWTWLGKILGPLTHVAH